MSRTKKQTNKSQSDLRFGPGDPSGFTAAGVAGFNDLNPAAVVRELLQNSLDAAREANRVCAIIRFEIEKHPINLVPGIDTYRSAFERAVIDQKKIPRGKLPDHATGVVGAMSDCLASSECTTLFVLDNGIGLDKSRMGGILADGLSIKGSEGTGAVGNGHLTVMPASDLRYVLYGGRTKQGNMIGSGHAILASHKQNGICRSKDGFYIQAFTKDLFNRYIFPRNHEVPVFVRRKLEWIANEWEPGSGTVVAVPGFNWFREEGEPLWDMVSKAAACNFFAAFAEGELRVEFRENGDEKVLDKSNIAATLEKWSTERNKRRGFPAGSGALVALETIKSGENVLVDTDIGRISMRWRLLPQGGPSRVELCRNGMWITDNPPKLKGNRFADFKPFHCLILLGASDGEVHRIVRKAEGPLHNHLEAKKWLSKEEKTALDRAMEAVFSKIKEVVPPQDYEQFQIEDVLAITSHGVSSGGRRPGLVGQFQEMRRPPRFPSILDQQDSEGGAGPADPENEGQGGGINKNRRGRGTFRRSGHAIRFSALPIPTDKRSYRVDLVPGEKTGGSEVRFALDESVDESCDPFGSEAFVRLKNVKIDGRPVPEKMLALNEEGQALGVRFGALDPEKMARIEFDYELPTDIELADDVPVVLKTQLIRRAPNSKNQEVS